MKGYFQGGLAAPGGLVSPSPQQIRHPLRKKLALILPILLATHLMSAQHIAWPRINIAPRTMTVDELLSNVEGQSIYRFFKKHIDDSLLKKEIFVSAHEEYLDHLLDRYLKKIGINWYSQDRMIVLAPLETPVKAPPHQQLSDIVIDVQELTSDTVPAVKKKVAQLDSVYVSHSYNNGYRNEKSDRLTGSFALLDSTLLRQTFSPYILDHLENRIPGILFNHGGQSTDGSSLPNQPIIRGRSTILADPTPIIVVDHFPYDGDLKNINPDDIENITILKDAAAAGIWGARAGNGVIVITTKKGRSARPLTEFSSNFSFRQRPDLFNIRTISAADEIAAERNQYDSGFYANAFNNPLSHFPVTPVVALLHAAGSGGGLSLPMANAQIDAMKGNDVRRDISKYLYRPTVSSQYSLNISGKTPANSYYFSVGWNHDPSTLAGSNYDRLTFRAQNAFTLSPRWKIDAGINFTEGTQTNGYNPGYNYQSIHGGKHYYSYAQLANNKGDALPLIADYDRSYLQNTAQLGFLDWTYRPAADIYNEQNTVKTLDYLLNTGIRYQPVPFIGLEMKYQLEYELTDGRDAFNDSSYVARNLINTYTQVDANGRLSYPLPPGGILLLTNTELTSRQGRAQLNITPTWDKDHQFSAILGYEIRNLSTTSNAMRFYGYDPDISSVNTSISYNTSYRSYQSNDSSMIPASPGISRKVDNFISYYTGMSYNLHQRYTSSISARKDEANLFGVNTNDKGVPLWSIGEGWDLSKEPFYHWGSLPYLKLRASYGYNGNIARQASAYTTALYQNQAVNTPLPTATLLSPPNANLRWERVGIQNYGLDFVSKKKILNGSIEYYIKSARDLVGEAPVDPTYGLATNPGSPAAFFGNVAEMKGKGYDVQLDIHVLDGRLKWTSNVLFSHAVSKVTKYLLPVTIGNAYLNQNNVNPIPGRPLYAIYSFPWKGLDGANGDPVGRYKGNNSKDWNSIWYNTSLDSLAYNGPAEPTSFGSWTNTLRYGHLSLSALISYKFGYYFRRPSINYSRLFDEWDGHSDYARRWRRPGDEKNTNVPSLVYTPNEARDAFYTYSGALVERADNIRLEDVYLQYDRDKPGRFLGIPYQRVHLYADASNLGLIWKANKSGTDPYYINVPRDGKRWTVGLHVIF